MPKCSTGIVYNDTTSGTSWTYEQMPVTIPYVSPLAPYGEQCKQERSDNMRYLYYVILVNPKNDDFFTIKVVAKSETSALALMEAYNKSQFKTPIDAIKYDDLKTNCKVLMEWKEEDSLKKAIETIKKAVE
jgi:hypothetical protein